MDYSMPEAAEMKLGSKLAIALFALVAIEFAAVIFVYHRSRPQMHMA